MLNTSQLLEFTGRYHETLRIQKDSIEKRSAYITDIIKIMATKKIDAADMQALNEIGETLDKAKADYNRAMIALKSSKK